MTDDRRLPQNGIEKKGLGMDVANAVITGAAGGAGGVIAAQAIAKVTGNKPKDDDSKK
jgi:hypothetical protein